VVHWVGVVVLSVAVLAVSVLILFPRVTGSQTFSVLTNSMAPKLGPGTFLVVGPTSYAGLRTGDVITYQMASGRPEVITHRIVGFGATQTGERTLITKGDNNSVVDPAPVREVQVRGRLLYAVPWVGYVANALGNSDRTTWVMVGALCLIGYGLLNLLRSARTLLAGRRIGKKQPATGEQP
jgi:signal peptidase